MISHVLHDFILAIDIITVEWLWLRHSKVNSIDSDRGRIVKPTKTTFEMSSHMNQLVFGSSAR